MDLSNPHLNPDSQAEGWINKNLDELENNIFSSPKLKFRFYYIKRKLLFFLGSRLRYGNLSPMWKLSDKNW